MNHLWANPVRGVGYADPYGQTVNVRGLGFYPGNAGFDARVQAAYGQLVAAEQLDGSGAVVYQQQMKNEWARGWITGAIVGGLGVGLLGFWMGRRSRRRR